MSPSSLPSSPTSPESPWCKVVRTAMERHDDGIALEYFTVSKTPPDLASLKLLVRYGDKELNDVLLPLGKDKGPLASAELFTAWVKRKDDLPRQNPKNLSVLYRLLVSNYLPPMDFVGNHLFPPTKVKTFHPDGSTSELPVSGVINHCHQYWLTKLVARTPLDHHGLDIIQTKVFPYLADNPEFAPPFFATLDRNPDRAIAIAARAKFQQQHAVNFWKTWLTTSHHPTLAVKTAKFHELDAFCPLPQTFQETLISKRAQFTHLHLSPIAYCAIYHANDTVEMLQSLGNLPELLHDVNRYAEVIYRDRKFTNEWYLPYLNPQHFNLLQEPNSDSMQEIPFLINWFTQDQVLLNPTVHDFLVHNFDRCSQIKFVPSTIITTDPRCQAANFLNYWQILNSKEPTIHLLSEQYQTSESLPLSVYATRLTKEVLDLQLPPSPLVGKCKSTSNKTLHL